MRSKLFMVLSTLFVLTSQAEARPIRTEWQFATSLSCVETCSRFGQGAESAGQIAVASNGDPNLYVCKAFSPGQESSGMRAGYNWNGSIGANRQPGCTVVGGRGYVHVQQFWCLCEAGRVRE